MLAGGTELTREYGAAHVAQAGASDPVGAGVGNRVATPSSSIPAARQSANAPARPAPTDPPAEVASATAHPPRPGPTAAPSASVSWTEAIDYVCLPVGACSMLTSVMVG